MNLNAKTEYACVALLELAKHYDAGKPVQVRKITALHGIPSPFLVQIFQDLKRAGLIISTRGAAGGYRLARPPQEITLCDVLDLVEGKKEPTTGTATTSPLAPVLLDVCLELADVRRKHLAGITLAELTARTATEVGPMWYI